jgi:hypothetical protein
MLEAEAECEICLEPGPDIFSSPYPGSLLLSAIAIALQQINN